MPSNPPAAHRDPELQARLDAALAAMPEGYEPRTHLKGPDGPKYVNRLILEGSPYLRQHAHNPVDWRPWGPEALAEADGRDVPVFLSIGYATCHWCHVMEEESFDDEAVAALLNAHFVPIKMDREQRPDLDHVFITATQLQNGHAGWPNSVWLLPDGRPFHTGTYFPKPQFMQVLQAVSQAWQEKRPAIVDVAERIAETVQRVCGRPEAGDLPEGTYGAAATRLTEMWNRQHGGFSDGTQFPQEGFLGFLLDHWRRTGNSLDPAIRSLHAIAAGGIHDHVGGGFHRYAVDVNWRTPHFEKMLYNQALVSRAMIEAWEATGDETFARAARRCFAYVLRDMTAPDGAFYAAEDADSLDPSGRLEEGAFYCWPPAEAGETAATLLNLHENPTLEAGPVAHLRPGEAQDWPVLDKVLEELRQRRDARPRPLRDEKVIAGWNGLMIRAFAEGGEAFSDQALVNAAENAANAVWTRLHGGNALARLAGETDEPGQLEDYAWMGLACTALFDATGNPDWLAKAESLAESMLSRFGDGAGGLKMAEAHGPTGPIYDSGDGAVPAGSSSALELLARLSRRSADPEHGANAHALLAALSGPMGAQPLIRTEALIAARLLEEGESTARRTLVQGTVRAELLERQRLVLRIAEGWHIVRAPAEGVEGVSLEGADVTWPEGRSVATGFAGSLELLDGTVEVALPEDCADVLVLRLQVCSDTLCLAPETARFRLR